MYTLVHVSFYPYFFTGRHMTINRNLSDYFEKLTYAVAHVPTQFFFVMAKFVSLSEGEQT